MKKQIEKLTAIHRAIENREQSIEVLQCFWQQWDAIGSREQMQKISKKIAKQEKAIKQLRAKAGQVCYDLIKEL